MPKTDKNKYRDFEWIRRVIESCKTHRQKRGPITRLRKLFYLKYNDINLDISLSQMQDNYENLLPR